jgi:uncharacterized membrane protein HdeD (DUF308 family)
MSQRRRAQERSPEDGREPAVRSPWRLLAVQVGVLAAIFTITVAVAELAGAANLGVALGIGQLVFAIALMALLMRT